MSFAFTSKNIIYVYSLFLEKTIAYCQNADTVHKVL